MQDDSCMKVLEKLMVLLFNIMTHTNTHTLVRYTLIFHAMAVSDPQISRFHRIRCS
jgi:hypothetical protein